MSGEKLAQELARLRERVAHLEAAEGRWRREKQAEHSMEEVECRTILNALGDAIHIVDQDRRIVFLNRAFQKWNELLGLRNEAIGQTLLEMFPFLPERVLGEYDQVFETGQMLLTEESTLIGDVELFTETRKIPVLDEGEVIQVITVIRDITERKQTEEELRRASFELRAIFQAQPDLFFRLRSDGTIIGFYAGRESDLYLRPESFLGRRMQDVLPPTVGSTIQKGISAALAGDEPVSVEYDLHVPSGEKTFEARIVPYMKKEDLVMVVRDITAHRLARDALKEERDFSAALLNTVGALVVVMDRQGKIVRFNRACEETTGYTFDEVQHKCIWDLFLLPEEVAPVQSVFEDLRSGLFPNTHENYWLTKSGDRRLIAWSNTTLLDERGSVAYVIGTGIDITEYRRAEVAIRHQAETLAALHETSLDLVTQRNLPDLLYAVVLRAQELLGAKRGGFFRYRSKSDDLELVLQVGLRQDQTGAVLRRGQGLAGKVLDEGRPLVVANYSCWEGRDEQFRNADFEACVVVPIRWADRMLGVLSLVDDAPREFSEADVALLERFAPLAAAAMETARLFDAERGRRHIAETLQRASIALNSTLELDRVLSIILQQLQQAIPYDSASIQRLQGTYLQVVACQGFADPASVIGLRFPLDPKFPNLRVVETRQAQAFEDVAKTYAHFEAEAGMFASGHIRSWLGVPLVARDCLIGMIALDRAAVDPYTDEQIELAMTFANHAAIAMENARLYNELQQQIEQVKRAQVQLLQSAKLAAVGELAAGVAHELNNPLTSVLGFSEMILEGFPAGSPLREDLETIVSESRRARDIVRNLLDFARQTKPQRQPNDINRILQQTLAVIRYHLEKSQVQIEEDYAGDIGFLMMDEGQLKQVFLNLISNAAQAMPGGGVLCVRTRKVGDQVSVSISDTGRGIDPAHLPLIFDPFYSTKPLGTGLGLSVSLGIVEEHRGRIAVESELGKGSTFTVWLPVGEESQQDQSGRS